MSSEPNLDEIAERIVLNFQSLEKSAGLSFSKAAKTMIRGRCAFLIYRARLLQLHPVPPARERKRRGLKIAEEAILTKQRLENLLALEDEGGAWVFVDWPFREWADGLKNAIAVVGEIADSAKLGASLPRKGGKPPLWLFKNFVRNLYAVYRMSGGRGKISYNSLHGYYYGRPLHFFREALDQVERLIPDTVKSKVVPKTNSARTRLIVEAIRTYIPIYQAKTRKKKEET